MLDGRADDRTRGQRADRELDRVVDDRGDEAGRTTGRGGRGEGVLSMAARTAGDPAGDDPAADDARAACDQVTSYGWARPGRRAVDPRATPLPAADHAGLAEPVVGGHDRRPAQAQLARQLPFGGQARPGRQQAAIDRARQGGRELFVEGVGAVGPEAQQFRPGTRPRPSAVLFSPLASDWLLDWSFMRCIMRPHQSNVNSRSPPDVGGGPERNG